MELLHDIFRVFVENHFSFVQYDDGIYHGVNVFDLMCGNNHQLLFRNRADKDFSELTFGRYVQPVGGFVQQKYAAISGQRESDEKLFSLPVWEFVQIVGVL